MRKKILLVDDDQAVLDFLQAKLGVRYDLVTTAAADAVMRLAHKEMPDLILCDIDMPELDGGDISAAALRRRQDALHPGAVPERAGRRPRTRSAARSAAARPSRRARRSTT